MTKTNLIIADVLFVAALITIYLTGDLTKYPIILTPLIIIALVTCVIRHVSYYKHTHRIY